MTQGPWYPSLSPDGQHWVGGIVELWVDGAIVGEGRQPVWQADGTILCAGPERGVWRYTAASPGQWTRDVVHGDAAVNRFSANSRGAWAYLTQVDATQPSECRTHDGRRYDDRYDVAVGPAGELALVDSRGALTMWRTVDDRGLVALDAQAGTLRWTEAGLCWTEGGSGGPRPWWWDGATVRPLAVTAPEWSVCLVRLGDDLWALTSSEHELLLRPTFEHWGYRLQSVRYPDARWDARTHRFRVIGTTARGAFIEQWVDPNVPAGCLVGGPSVPVTTPCPTPVIPTPTPDPVEPIMWTEAHARLLRALFPRLTLPCTDESARAWTKSVAEQFCYSFPAQGWGQKRASGPPSKDSIATRTPLYGYDVLTATGSHYPTLVEQPTPLDLTKEPQPQEWLAVDPVNHLGAADPSPGLPPTSEPAAFAAWLTALEARVVALEHPSTPTAGLRPGDRIALRSGRTGQWLCDDGNLDGEVRANRDTVDAWETWTVERGRTP